MQSAFDSLSLANALYLLSAYLGTLILSKY